MKQGESSHQRHGMGLLPDSRTQTDYTFQSGCYLSTKAAYS
jgi:hypothetical protein